MRKTSIKLIAAVAAVGLVFAACAEDESTSNDTTADTEAPAGTEAPAATEAPADSEATDRHRGAGRYGQRRPAPKRLRRRRLEGDFSQEEIDQWGIDYTGSDARRGQR